MEKEYKFSLCDVLELYQSDEESARILLRKNIRALYDWRVRTMMGEKKDSFFWDNDRVVRNDKYTHDVEDVDSELFLNLDEFILDQKSQWNLLTRFWCYQTMAKMKNLNFVRMRQLNCELWFGKITTKNSMPRIADMQSNDWWEIYHIDWIKYDAGVEMPMFLSEHQSDSDVAKEVDEDIKKEKFWGLFNTLSSEWQKIFSLMMWWYTSASIARQTGISKQAVSSTRLKLQAYFEIKLSFNNLIIEPLMEDYKFSIIPVRRLIEKWTDIVSHCNLPKTSLRASDFNEQFKWVEKIENVIAKWLWESFHSLAWLVMTSTNINYDQVDTTCKLFSNLYWDRFSSIQGKVVRQLDSLPKIEVSNFPIQLFVEYWRRLFIIRWIADGIRREWDKFIVSEVKTTKKKRTEEMIEWNKQMDIYALMLYYNCKIEADCEYVFINTDSWEVTTHRYTPDLKATEEMIHSYCKDYK